MLFIKEISVTKLKSMSKEKTEYASHIPADRLIHIMRFGRKMLQSEWDILEAYIEGETIVDIALRLGVSRQHLHRRIRKISERMLHSVLG